MPTPAEIAEQEKRALETQSLREAYAKALRAAPQKPASMPPVQTVGVCG